MKAWTFMYEKKFIEDLFKLHIDNSYGRRDFRPQAVAVLYNKDKKVLITLNEQHHIWAPPQEGIKRGETLEDGLLRCLAEELYNKHPKNMTIEEWYKTMNHLKSISLKAIVHGFYHERRITPGRSREGFFGKEYFYSRAKYIGDGNFEYGPETEEHDWLKSKEVRAKSLFTQAMKLKKW